MGRRGGDAARERAEGHAATLSLSTTCNNIRDCLGREGIGVERGLAQRVANVVNYHMILLEDIT